MQIGIPKEIKNHEYRVALKPEDVRQLVAAGHGVRVEHGAGAGVGYGDDAYQAAGATLGDAPAVWRAELVVKVKEPQPAEIGYLGAGQILFCYLHLAAAPALARALMARGVSAIGFETVGDAQGGLPLLAPMSEIAGRLAPQVGAQALTKIHGGCGLLAGGMPGVPPAHIVILGAGTVGTHAARIAHGLGARVTVLDRRADKLARIEAGGHIVTRFSTPDAIADVLPRADIVIGAAQIPGRHAPRLITRDRLKTMRPGSALVDVAIDQGGVSETSRPSTHSDPFYIEEGIVHYCVANMPGAVARTATLALSHALLPYVSALAAQGLAALDADPGFKAGLQVHAGRITHPGLAEELA
jgi:alanine dehydrogenase